MSKRRQVFAGTLLMLSLATQVLAQGSCILEFEWEQAPPERSFIMLTVTNQGTGYARDVKVLQVTTITNPAGGLVAHYAPVASLGDIRALSSAQVSLPRAVRNAQLMWSFSACDRYR